MKRFAMAALVAGSISAWAGDPIKVKIMVFDYTKLSSDQLYGSLAETTNVFRKAGIELNWCVGLAASDECIAEERQTGEPHFLLNLLNEAMAGRLRMRSKHFGFAKAGTAYIHVPRTRDLARDVGITVDVVLGHLIAHELGHVVLGPENHAPKGVMKAFLRKSEFEMASQGRLGFSSEAAQRMRERLGR